VGVRERVGACLGIVTVVGLTSLAGCADRTKPVTAHAPHAAVATTTTTLPRRRDVGVINHAISGDNIDRSRAAPGALDVRRLAAPLKLFGWQLLVYPPRPNDVPAISAAAALHPKDGGGNPLGLVRYSPIRPIVVLVRFTDVISVARQDHHVDQLVWLVVFNDVTVRFDNVPLYPQGKAAGPPPPPPHGYALVAVDARTGVAFTEYQSGPPIPKGQL
jgi:hypothetical protein